MTDESILPIDLPDHWREVRVGQADAYTRHYKRDDGWQISPYSGLWIALDPKGKLQTAKGDPSSPKTWPTPTKAAEAIDKAHPLG